MRSLKLLFLLLMVLTSKAYGQSKGFPAPYEITADTATIIRLPYKNWQYLKETKKPLSLNEAIALNNSFKYNVAKQTKENTTDHSTFWLRAKIKNNLKYPLRITISGNSTQMEAYIADSTGVWKKYLTGYNVPWSKKDGLKRINALVYTIPANAVVTIYKRVANDSDGLAISTSIGIANNVIKEEYIENDKLSISNLSGAALFGFLLFAAIINFFFFYTVRERVYLLYAILLLIIAFLNIDTQLLQLFFNEHAYLLDHEQVAFGGVLFLILIIALLFLQVPKNHPRWNKILAGVSTFFFLLTIGRALLPESVTNSAVYGYTALTCFAIISIGLTGTLIIDLIAKRPAAKLLMLATLPLLTLLLVAITLSIFNQSRGSLFDLLLPATLLWPVIVLSWSLFDRFKMALNENAMRAYENERLAREKEEERNQLIAQQKDELEIQVAQRTAELSTSLTNLKSAQSQLVQSEKMASLGELTAGIAHEIQNPLNFVNNFSEVNAELIDEMQQEIDKGDYEEAKAIAHDIKENQQKISQHGKRADFIVKGMLQHSRTSTGEKQLTNINTLADEFLKLSYHGLRAKDKNFNAELVTDFDDTLPKVNVAQQDIGRVLLNLFNNAFYAVNEKKKTAGDDYKPTVTVTTFTPPSGGWAASVRDNGNGIPDAIKEKIMQPFFTTKPTGEGTGLGLSLSYDIVVKGHGGSIDIESVENEYSIFIIKLPHN